VITGFARFAARESGSIENTARLVRRLLKIGRGCGARAFRLHISGSERLSGNGLMELHKILISEANRPELS
jgi:hypothetical protein